MTDYDNDYETMIMYCDGPDCDKELELEGAFIDCIQEAKDNGWRISKDEDEYQHYCPRCWANRGAQGVFNE